MKIFIDMPIKYRVMSSSEPHAGLMHRRRHFNWRMNNRLMNIIAAAILILSVQAHAQIFKVAGGDADTVSVGDTLVAPEDRDITIHIENGSRLLVKAGAALVLGGEGCSLDVALVDGQIFFDRRGPREFEVLRVVAGSCVFTPVGTAFAVKTTPQGAPTVAVLRGAALMRSAKGEVVQVEEGRFGTVTNAGRLVSGELSERGLAQLEAWTGVKVGPLPVEEPEPEPVVVVVEESPVVVDDDDKNVVDTVSVVVEEKVSKKEAKRLRKEAKKLEKEARKNKNKK